MAVLIRNLRSMRVGLCDGSSPAGSGAAMTWLNNSNALGMLD
jgi:hypothetical protein